MDDLLRVSAALQKQATRDLGPIWEISATVDAFAKLEDVPDGYWPMIIRDDIGVDAAGIHKDPDGQPFALISAAATVDQWSLTASHEMCEMLVDPSGDRQATGDSPVPGQGRVSFLVEVCDPSEGADFAYRSNTILVSDFYTPHYFDPGGTTPGVRYSFTGNITQPREVLRGGYLSWKNAVTGDWWQKIWFDTDQPTTRNIGPRDATSGSMRMYIDRLTGKNTAKALDPSKIDPKRTGMTCAQAQKSLTGTATMWRQQISTILGQPEPPPPAVTKPAPKSASPRKKAARKKKA
jgi:hypothetical protein